MIFLMIRFLAVILLVLVIIAAVFCVCSRRRRVKLSAVNKDDVPYRDDDGASFGSERHASFRVHYRQADVEAQTASRVSRVHFRQDDADEAQTASRVARVYYTQDDGETQAASRVAHKHGVMWTSEGLSFGGSDNVETSNLAMASASPKPPSRQEQVQLQSIPTPPPAALINHDEGRFSFAASIRSNYTTSSRRDSTGDMDPILNAAIMIAGNSEEKKFNVMNWGTLEVKTG
jgi:hypothetical protein